MKIRMNFVSNSSSASFIFMQGTVMDKVSAADIDAALDSLMSDDGKLPEDDYRGYHTYDLTTEEGRQKADDELRYALEGWISYGARRNHKGEIVQDPDSETAGDWDKMVEEFQRENDEKSLSLWISDNACEIWGGKKPTREQKDLIDRYWECYRKLGVCDHRDVIRSPSAHMVLHFDDNELYRVPGMGHLGGLWSTEEDTMDRLFELLVNELQLQGKLPADVTWKEMEKSLGGWCCHEG